MSSLNVTFSKEAFIYVCLGIKGHCVELYHYYSRLYTDIPGAYQLWE